MRRSSRYASGANAVTLAIWHKRSFFRPVNACRHQIHYEYLLGDQMNVDHVMMTDIRDVIFQSHPFAGMTNNKCHSFLERKGEYRPWL
jgi:hypothetical protein